jgi:hypothetical protein
MGFASAASKVGSPIVKVGSKRHNEYQTGTGEFAGNYQGTGKLGSSTYGANKSIANRAMGTQSKGGQQAQQAASGNVGVVSQGMVNAEIQNDDVLDPTKLMGM